MKIFMKNCTCSYFVNFPLSHNVDCLLSGAGAVTMSVGQGNRGNMVSISYAVGSRLLKGGASQGFLAAVLKVHMQAYCVHASACLERSFAPFAGHGIHRE